MGGFAAAAGPLKAIRRRFGQSLPPPPPLERLAWPPTLRRLLLWPSRRSSGARARPDTCALLEPRKSGPPAVRTKTTQTTTLAGEFQFSLAQISDATGRPAASSAWARPAKQRRRTWSILIERAPARVPFGAAQTSSPRVRPIWPEANARLGPASSSTKTTRTGNNNINWEYCRQIQPARRTKTRPEVGESKGLPASSRSLRLLRPASIWRLLEPNGRMHKCSAPTLSKLGASRALELQITAPTGPTCALARRNFRRQREIELGPGRKAVSCSLGWSVGSLAGQPASQPASQSANWLSLLAGEFVSRMERLRCWCDRKEETLVGWPCENWLAKTRTRALAAVCVCVRRAHVFATSAPSPVRSISFKFCARRSHLLPPPPPLLPLRLLWPNFADCNPRDSARWASGRQFCVCVR